jgi:hypothetical protein
MTVYKMCKDTHSNEYSYYLKIVGIHYLEVCLLTSNYIYHNMALRVKKTTWIGHYLFYLFLVCAQWRIAKIYLLALPYINWEDIKILSCLRNLDNSHLSPISVWHYMLAKNALESPDTLCLLLSFLSLKWWNHAWS